MSKSSSHAMSPGGALSFEPWTPGAIRDQAKPGSDKFSHSYLVQVHSDAMSLMLEAVMPMLDRLLSQKTVAGGVVVGSGIHIWMADTQTAQSRKDWQTTLSDIAKLKPAVVVPGHFLGEAPKGLAAVTYTADYLKAFEAEAAKAKDSTELTSAMKARYPQAGQAASLELSANVIKGEMKWPQ